MSSKEEVTAAARNMIDTLKAYASVVESRSEFSSVMAAAQNTLSAIHIITGERTPEQIAAEDLFVELREVKYSGPLTFTYAPGDPNEVVPSAEDPNKGQVTITEIPADQIVDEPLA